ncbi:uncharacterized protein [Eucyclogobius newberryi]|uniref:uncharacterized protein n=1 Tax=Eucyclogobius newberryi TaxID=166745 RepID=UPI003B5964B1
MSHCICRFEEFKCLFILDGLDESRLQLDFTKTPAVSNVREKTSIEILLVNLIRGELLPSAQVWITSRPAAANQIAASCVDMVTEVRGFTNAQKEIYFRKKFRDEEQASKVLTHVKASRSVHSMCYIPVFSWITAKVMDHVLQTGDGKLPQTLTELYIHFVVVQAKMTNMKYKNKSDTDLHWTPEGKNTLKILSKLAFDQLEKGNLIFYESDLIDCGIDLTEASVYSGVFTQWFKEEQGLYKDKVFSFVHLSVQEFLAALHVHITFMDDQLPEKQSLWSKLFHRKPSLIQFYRTTVDKALESQNGHLDLFLRFFLGLSLESNQRLLRGLVKPTGSPESNQETAKYLKAKLESGLSVKRNLTLLQCLIELKDTSLCEEVQAWLSSEKIPSDLSPAQWTALVCILLSTEEPELYLSKYQQSETALLDLMPIVKQSTKALLSGCGLTDKACEALASGLDSQCSLSELDLSNNPLQDSGVLVLCEGLKKPDCALQTLRLIFCGLSARSCEALGSVLDSETNSLRELDLSNNDLQDSGVQTLCIALKSPHCKLETLRLSGCQVSESGCASLVSALSSGGLKELDLSYNNPGPTEAKKLTELFDDPQKKLSLDHGGEERLREGLSKYACQLIFDPNTANQRMIFSNNDRSISLEQEKQSYPDHAERFHYWKQVLCVEGLRGRSYWEVEWTGDVYIAVTYKSIKRKGEGDDSCLGKNALSWSFGCTEETFSVLHENKRRSFKSKSTNQVGVYLDWEGGVLSFYAVSPEQKIHLQTFKTRFTEEVHPAFRIKTKPFNSSITLCELKIYPTEFPQASAQQCGASSVGPAVWARQCGASSVGPAVWGQQCGVSSVGPAVWGQQCGVSSVGAAVWGQQCGASSVGPAVWGQQCGPGSVGPAVWGQQCRASSVGPAVWGRQCGAGSVGPAVWGRQCGAGSVGPAVWARQCGASSVGSAVWGQQCGVSSVGQQCGASSVGQQCGASSVGPAVWGQQCGPGSVGPAVWGQQCGASSVGPAVWARQCGASSVGPAVWGQQCGASSCGAGSVGPAVWGRQCGAGSVGSAVWGQQCGASSVGPAVWGQQCGPGSVGPAVWGQQCRASSVGPAVWGRQCGAGSVGPAVWGRQCGAGSVGPAVWARQCGASSVGSAVWGQQCGVSSVGQQCGASSVGQQCGASSVGPAVWGQQCGPGSVGPAVWGQQCGASSVGPAVWARQCGASSVGPAVWGQQCGASRAKTLRYRAGSGHRVALWAGYISVGPLVLGTGPSVLGTGPLVQGMGPLVLGTGPLVQGTGLLVLGTGPLVLGSGPLVQGMGPSVLGTGPSVLGTGPLVLGTGPSVLGTGPSVLGTGPSVQGTGPSVLGTGPLVQGTGPLVQGTGPSVLGTGPLVLGTGPLVLGMGPLVQGTGPLVQGMGPSVLGMGPSVLGTGPLVLGTGPLVLGSGPLVQGMGPSVLGTGPSVLGTGPSVLGTGPLVLGTGPSVLGTGPLVLGTGPLNCLCSESSDPQKCAEGSSAGETDVSLVFKLVEKELHELVSVELRMFQNALSADWFKQDCSDGEESDQRKRSREAVLDLTLCVLKKKNQELLADSLKNRVFAHVCRCQMNSTLKTKFQVVFEGIREPGKASLLDEVYTELLLTEGEASQMNEEHEVTQIQMRPTRTVTTIRCSDLFIPAPERPKRNRVVMTKGVAGVGKTVLTQKFSLDWAEGRNNQELNFIFPFTFRELNLFREETSLYGLIGHFFTQMSHCICRFEEFKCLFILDGLDESRLQLDFTKTPAVSNVREKTSIEILLVNLIRGELLPSAQVWITSRPAAANQIAASCVDMVTEVRGFTNAQKEIYFRKKFRDKEQASKVLTHVKASRSVHSMCYIPVFSWITAKVMDHVLQTGDGKLPQTLTELYIHFVVVQAKITNIKYKNKSDTDLHWTPEGKNTLKILSKLAFDQLEKGNLIFYESDLIDCGIDLTEASVYSGVFTQWFKEEQGLYKDKVFSFVHLSVQEFLAALHVHITFMDDQLPEKQSLWSKLFHRKPSLIQFYRTTVDKALESQNGHLDLFLRFFLGLSLESNQRLLRGLVKPTGSPELNQETAKYLKAKLESGLSVERNLTLLQCLIELKDTSLCEEVQAWLSSEKIPSDLSPAQWTALVSILLSTEEPEFDLSKYQQSETALLNLMPIVKQSTKALLSGCGLTDKACEALASGLDSQCSLSELDLSNNPLQDSGVLVLCEGLKKPDCALQTLRLIFCGLSARSCEALGSVLDSETNSLRELDLSNNDLQDSGVQTLCIALKSPHCKLETLRLSGCQVSESGCASLVSALSSGGLKELDLSYNNPGPTEAKKLTELFDDPQKKLSLDHGGEERLREGLSKYACQLIFDPNTANQRMIFSNNDRSISLEQEKQSYPDHAERFHYWKQVLCVEGLRGRSYWEVEWTGDVYIAVTYKSIKRKGEGDDSCLGKNALSWSFGCTEETFSVLHENKRRSFKSKPTNRVGVYLDWEGGVLSFYAVSPEQKIHLQTFKTRFTEEVHPAFRIKTKPFNSSITLCELKI